MGQWLSQQLKDVPQSRSLLPLLAAAVLGCGFILRQKESNMNRSPQERHTPWNVPREERNIWAPFEMRKLPTPSSVESPSTRTFLHLSFWKCFSLRNSNPSKTLRQTSTKCFFPAVSHVLHLDKQHKYSSGWPKEQGNGNELHFQVAVILFGQEQSSLKVKGLASRAYHLITRIFHHSLTYPGARIQVRLSLCGDDR